MVEKDEDREVIDAEVGVVILIVKPYDTLDICVNMCLLYYPH